MSKVTKPTLSRYERVSRILMEEPAFKNEAGPEDYKVDSEDGSSVGFSREVAAVVHLLHVDGNDGLKCPCSDIVSYAQKIIKQKKLDGGKVTVIKVSNIVPDANRKKSQPKKIAAVKKPAEKPAPKKKKPAVKKAAKKAAVKKPVAKSGKNPPAVVNKKSPKRKVVKQPEPPKTKEVTFPEELAQKFKKDERYGPKCGIVSCMASAYQLAEMYDRTPGHSERLERLADLMNDYEPELFVVEAKETPSTNASVDIKPTQVTPQ